MALAPLLALCLVLASTASVVRAADKECPDYTDVLHRVYNGPVKDRPQLTEHHATWITTVLQTQEAVLGRRINFLVFGLGRDSLMWHDVNCAGRTVFLENNEVWFKMVMKMHPQLKAHKVTYKGRLGKRKQFFAEPWLMPVPQSVRNTCFDVVLVDSPMGWKPDQPGRMESSYYALQNAVRCVSSGKLDAAFIFLHDLDRPGERDIEAALFTPDQGVASFGGIGTKKMILHAYVVNAASLAARSAAAKASSDGAEEASAGAKDEEGEEKQGGGGMNNAD